VPVSERDWDLLGAEATRQGVGRTTVLLSLAEAGGLEALRQAADAEDCLLCLGTDPECPGYHGPLDWPADADQVLAEYVASLIHSKES